MGDDIPFIAVGNDELKDKPTIRVGDTFICENCKSPHTVEGTDGALLVAKCHDAHYVVGIKNKLYPSLIISEHTPISRNNVVELPTQGETHE